MSNIDFNGFRIDHSTGTPILMYKDCSVIESEVAELVMQLIANHRTQPPAEDAEPSAWIVRAPDGKTFLLEEPTDLPGHVNTPLYIRPSLAGDLNHATSVKYQNSGEGQAPEEATKHFLSDE
jgi:hypothetical protein